MRGGTKRILVGLYGVATLSLWACDGTGTDPEQFRPPPAYVVMGEAGGAVGALTIDCAFELAFEWDGAERLETGRVYVASGGGEAERRVLRPDGSGLSFAPTLVLEEHHLRLLGGDSLVLESLVDLETGVPFYEGIGRMPGVVTGPHTAQGSWSCAPVDAGGDSVGVVAGSWRLEPRG